MPKGVIVTGSLETPVDCTILNQETVARRAQEKEQDPRDTILDFEIPFGFTAIGSRSLSNAPLIYTNHRSS